MLFDTTPGGSGRQEGLACSGPWGHEESEMTKRQRFKCYLSAALSLGWSQWGFVSGHQNVEVTVRKITGPMFCGGVKPLIQGQTATRHCHFPRGPKLLLMALLNLFTIIMGSGGDLSVSGAIALPHVGSNRCEEGSLCSLCLLAELQPQLSSHSSPLLALFVEWQVKSIFPQTPVVYRQESSPEEAFRHRCHSYLCVHTCPLNSYMVTSSVSCTTSICSGYKWLLKFTLRAGLKGPVYTASFFVI